MQQFEKTIRDYLLSYPLIKCILFDLDDTLVPEHTGNLSEDISTTIKKLDQEGYKIVIVSNNFNSLYCLKIIEKLSNDKINILFVENAYKPFKNVFSNIQSLTGCESKQVLLVGDGILTDHLSAHLMNYHFIKANWFDRSFYKETPLLLIVRELSVILYDFFRLIFFKNKTRYIYLKRLKEQQDTRSKKFLFLINPHSSKTNYITLSPLIQNALLDTDNEYTIHLIDNIKNVHRLYAERLKNKQYTHVIASGGDGTMREAITLIVNNNPDATLGILPTGTGNLLAKYLKIPLDLQEAVKIACFGKMKMISISSVNNSYSALLVGLGSIADVMAESDSVIKKRFGIFAYLLNGIKVAFKRKRAIYNITLDDKKSIKRYADTVLVIQRNCFNKAFLPLEVMASIPEMNDEVLDICISKPKSLWEDFKILHAIFFNSYQKKRVEHATQEPYFEHYFAKKVRIKSFPRQKVQVDGDLINDSVIQAAVLKNVLKVNCLIE